MIKPVVGLSILICAGLNCAQANEVQESILIKNAIIFDGVNEKLLEGQQVYIEGGIITKMAKTISPSATTTVIDAKGKVMTPGLIDAHYHLALCSTPMGDIAGPYAPDLDYSGILAAQEAERVLLRGFTSIRDLGGAAWGAKVAADRGLIKGPRVWTSLRTISQTGGHGDASPRFAVPREFGGGENWAERIHYSRIVNGKQDVLAAVRDNLKKGASQIKIHAGGGVGTEHDPIDGLQFTQEELRAIVEVAENYGTYVAAHVYTPKGIEAAINAGVKSIEHGNLVDEKVIKLMAKKDVWLSPQTHIFSQLPPSLGEKRLAKGLMVQKGLDTMFEMAKKHDVNIAFGTDIILSGKTCAEQNQEFVARTEWFTPFEILKQATSLSGELLQLSGPRSPYPGTIGIIETGALADVLLIDGNPLEDISILADANKNIDVIIKAGQIVKHQL